MNEQPNPEPIGSPASAPSHTWELLCHLTALAGYFIPLGNIIGPLVIWLIKKDEIPAVDAHGKESLNFQISVTIYAVVCIVLVFVLIGFFLLIALAIFQLIFVIIASVKAANGESYQYPLTIRLVT